LLAIKSAIRARLGFSHAASRDVDAEQAFLRALIGGGILLYATYVALTSSEIGKTLALVMVAASIPLLAGMSMLWWFRRHSDRPASMRYVAICADLIPLTVGLWGADEFGVPLIGFYLWVTVGNGFRFGPRMLMFAYWVSNICFLALLIFGPFWRSHTAIGIGFALILASIPLYVLVLLSRLTAQKDAALELSNAKSRFVANVSHELRTPLTGVYAVHELLRRRKLAPDEKSLVASLGHAIGTLKASVDAVLQMSKLEAGAERTDPKIFNLPYFLLQITKQFAPSAANKGLEWSVRVDDSLPVVAFGDPSHLQHIVGNLLNNAFKFTHSGGVKLYVAPVARGIRFDVVDSGIGIPKDKQATLFERFVQADATATRRYGGTGLGTSIAHDLTKLMGGAIGVESTPGQGSRFWIELPIATLPAEGAGAERLLNCRVQVLGDRSDAKPLEESLRALRANYDIVEHGHPQDRASAAVAVVVGLGRAAEESFPKDTLETPWLIADRTASDAPLSVVMSQGAAGVISDWSPRGLLQNLQALANTALLFASVADSVRTEAGASYRILLADDNKSNQVLLARILEGGGHKVLCASRGDEAFDLLTSSNVDIAILDLNMPDMSGEEVVKMYRMGEVGSGKRVPVVILSADATSAAREGSLAAGADEFLTKPVMAGDLLAAIDRLMAGVAGRGNAGAAGGSDLSVGPSKETRRPVDREGLAPGLVDIDRIDALRRIASDDRAFLQRYVGAAFDDLEAAIRELHGAIGAQDAQSCRDALHKIDGTASSLGADALLRSAKSMRGLVVENVAAPKIGDALAELSTLCALTKSTLAASLQDPNRRTIREP